MKNVHITDHTSIRVLCVLNFPFRSTCFGGNITHRNETPTLIQSTLFKPIAFISCLCCGCTIKNLTTIEMFICCCNILNSYKHTSLSVKYLCAFSHKTRNLKKKKLSTCANSCVCVSFKRKYRRGFDVVVLLN